VKAKIETEHKMQADMMKLIAYGKVMDDDNKSLKDYSIKEGDFLVVMISKVRLLKSVYKICVNRPSQLQRENQRTQRKKRAHLSSSSKLRQHNHQAGHQEAHQHNNKHLQAHRHSSRTCHPSQRKLLMN